MIIQPINLHLQGLTVTLTDDKFTIQGNLDIVRDLQSWANVRALHGAITALHQIAPLATLESSSSDDTFKFIPFSDQSASIGELTLESDPDKMSFYGNFSLGTTNPRKAALTTLRNLRVVVQSIFDVFAPLASAKILPARIVEAAKSHTQSVPSPF
jgi:hypothetical protein